MSIPATSATTCFACGKDNPQGLGIQFELEEALCYGNYCPDHLHCGYPGVTHGGLIFTALDDVMANWFYLRGATGFTARCDIRYRQPTPTGTHIRLEGRLLKLKGKLAIMSGLAINADNQQVLAQTEGRFMIESGLEHIKALV